MGEIKQTNLRLDQDEVEQFRVFCNEMGLNQAQGFSHMIQVLELDRAKNAIPDRLTEIENFEKYTKDIIAAYLNSLEINRCAEGRIREQFVSALNQKDKVIADLQAKIDQLSAEKQTAEQGKDTAENAQATAEEREKNAIEQMDAAKKTASDQERINIMLSGQLADATEKLEGYDDLKKSEAELKKQITKLQNDAEKSSTLLAHTKELYETRLDKMKEISEKLDSAEKSNAELQIQLANAKSSLAEQKKSAQIELDLATERASIAKEREMQTQLRQADKENAKLSAQIALLLDKVKIFEEEGKSISDT